MPSKTPKQARFMRAVAHSPEFAKKVGVPASVGKEFVKADKGRQFKEGGEMAAKKLFGGKESYSEELKEAKAIKSGKITPQQYARGEKSEEAKAMKKGGKCYAAGGYTRSADGIAKKGKTKAKQIVMKKGGKC